MIVKSIVLVVLLGVFSTANAQSFDTFETEFQEYISSIQQEAMSLGSLDADGASFALRRAHGQFYYIRSEYEYGLSKWKDGHEAAFGRLGQAIETTQEILTQNMAIAIGIGAIKIVLTDLQKAGKISHTSVTWGAGERSTTRGTFWGFNGRYPTRMGLKTSTREIKLSYVDAAKKQHVEVMAIVGSQLQTLKELESLMNEGTTIASWILGDVNSVMGLVENELRRFILQGTGVNFEKKVVMNDGVWREVENFHTYLYGIAFIVDAEVRRQ